MKNLIIILIGFFIVNSASGQAITRFDNRKITIAQIDNMLPVLLDSAGMIGFSVAMVQEGKIVYHRTFGLANRQNRTPATDNTIFEGASLAKPLVAFLVWQLVQEGRFNLDKPLFQYLPNPDLWNDLRYQRITARMILSHSSGLPNWRDYNGLRLGFQPGTAFNYSSEGFMYLQRVLERLTGKKLNELMNERIFVPLGMKSSSMVWRWDYESRYADRHDSTGKTLLRLRATEAWAAGTLYTNAEDYARFVLHLFENPNLADELFNPQVKVNTPVAYSQNLWWGLGFGLQENNKGMYFFHWGDNIYSKAYFAGSLERETALIFFSNQENGLRIRNKLMQRLLGVSDHPTLEMLNFGQF